MFHTNIIRLSANDRPVEINHTKTDLTISAPAFRWVTSVRRDQNDPDVDDYKFGYIQSCREACRYGLYQDHGSHYYATSSMMTSGTFENHIAIQSSGLVSDTVLNALDQALVQYTYSPIHSTNRVETTTPRFYSHEVCDLTLGNKPCVSDGCTSHLPYYSTFTQMKEFRGNTGRDIIKRVPMEDHPTTPVPLRLGAQYNNARLTKVVHNLEFDTLLCHENQRTRVITAVLGRSWKSRVVAEIVFNRNVPTYTLIRGALPSVPQPLTPAQSQAILTNPAALNGPTLNQSTVIGLRDNNAGTFSLVHTPTAFNRALIPANYIALTNQYQVTINQFNAIR